VEGLASGFADDQHASRLPAGDAADWDVQPEPPRIVAIGDLHGDLRAFGAIARECRLVNERGGWCGGDTHLVLMGDLMGGARSRLLLRAVMRLEREALRAGGRVHTLLGNHDLLPVAGRFEMLTSSERRQYRKGDFRGDGPYAAWLRSRPTILKIGPTVFVHAGLDRWALDTDPAEVNAQVRAWIAHQQGTGPKPPKATRWAVDDERGPLWTRVFKARRRKPKHAPSKKTIREILERLGADRIVLGHSPTRDGSIVTDHPHYGGSVVLIDTRISDTARGRLGALILEDGALRTVYARDRAEGDALCEREARDAAQPTGLLPRVAAAIARLFGKSRSR
jgi:hypothetical protein